MEDGEPKQARSGATRGDGRDDRTIRWCLTNDGRAPFDARSRCRRIPTSEKGRTSVVIADVATHAFLSTSSLTSEFLASVLTSLEMRISIHVIIANERFRRRVIVKFRTSAVWRVADQWRVTVGTSDTVIVKFRTFAVGTWIRRQTFSIRLNVPCLGIFPPRRNTKQTRPQAMDPASTRRCASRLGLHL
jgi:hypothetical protein